MELCAAERQRLKRRQRPPVASRILKESSYPQHSHQKDAYAWNNDSQQKILRTNPLESVQEPCAQKQESYQSEPDFAVNLNKELNTMLAKLGPTQVESIMAVVTEARLREEIDLPAREPLHEELLELRGEDHSACDIGLRNARFYYDLGWEMRCKGDIHGAVELLERSVKLNSEDMKTWANLGYLQAQLGKLDKAREALQEATRLEPKLSVLHFNLGVICLKSHRFQDAVKCLDIAIKLDSSRPEYFRARALAHRRRKIQMTATTEVVGDFYAASQDYVVVRREQALHAEKAPESAGQTNHEAHYSAAKRSPVLTQKGLASDESPVEDLAPIPILDQRTPDGARTRIISYPGLHPLFFEASQFWDQVGFQAKMTFGKYEEIASIDPHDRTHEQVQALAGVSMGLKYWKPLSKDLHIQMAQHIRILHLEERQHVPEGLHCILLRGKLELFRQHNVTALETIMETLWPGGLAETSGDTTTWRAAEEACALYMPLPKLQQMLTRYTKAKASEHLDSLRQFSLFEGISEDTIQALILAMGPEKHFTADEIVVKRGEHIRKVGFLLHGKCEYIRHQPHLNKHHVVGEVGTKDFFNETLLMPRTNASKARLAMISIVCKTTSTVLFLDIKDLYRLTTFQERQKLRKNLDKQSNKRLKLTKGLWKTAQRRSSRALLFIKSASQKTVE